MKVCKYPYINTHLSINIIQAKLMKNYKSNLKAYLRFLIMISINLFCCYENMFMDEWEKFTETSFPEREGFYSNLNMEDNTDTDYTHAKRIL